MERRSDYLDIANDIRQSKKYRHLSLDTVYRIVEWAGARFKVKEIDKNARKKLHQVYGAYTESFDLATFARKLEGLQEHGSKDGFAEILLLHSSSKERVGLLGDFYRRIFEFTGRPTGIIDLACGLNPFSYPWINDCQARVPYAGFDIDLGTTENMQAFFAGTDYPVTVGYNDLFEGLPPHEESDLVMLLKTLPCLEQQEKGISRQLLGAIKSRKIVVSFPAQSLGGKQKGMVENYRHWLQDCLEGQPYAIHEIFFSTETVYILERKV